MLSAAVFFPVNRLAKAKTSIGLVEFHSSITTKHRKNGKDSLEESEKN